MVKILTEKNGIFNIYFEDAEGNGLGAVFNATKSKEHSKWVQENEHLAVPLEQYLEDFKNNSSEAVEEVDIDG